MKRITLVLIFAFCVAALVSNIEAQPPQKRETRSAPTPTPTTPNSVERLIVSIKVGEGTKLAFDVSPDGRVVVFDLLGQLWLLPASGGAATALTDAVRDTAEDRDPAFSPDGRWIAFRSNRPGGSGLWIIPLSGGAARRLTTGSDSAPAWSPDGRRLAFVRGDRIQVLEVETGTVTPVQIEGLPSPPARDPAWWPDTPGIVFTNASTQAFAGGALYEVAAGGGPSMPRSPQTRRVLSPAPSPDGRWIAYFSRDAQERAQLWVEPREGGPARQLADHPDTTPLRARWARDGTTLMYSADGRLWRVPAGGGPRQEIPFSARLVIRRRQPDLSPVRFARPMTSVRARGHMGLALSPDGTRIAVVALGQLWVFRPGARPSAVAAVPETAAGLSWSPDSRRVAWSAGPAGAEDIHSMDVTSGATTRLTGLPGSEVRPSWSPNGQHLAFIHWQKPALPTPPSDQRDSAAYLRVADAAALPVERVEATRALGELPVLWAFSFFPQGQEIPQWSPDSSGLLMFSIPLGAGSSAARFLPLAGAPRLLERFPTTPTFVRWVRNGSIVFVERNLVWRAPFTADGGLAGQPVQVTDDPSIYPSAADDGSVLYVSHDGLRLRRRDGSLQRLGWPIRYDTPKPSSVLLKRVRVIDGKGTAASAAQDIFIDAGRVVRMGPTGSLRAPAGTRVIDAGGRFVIPGLIDAHAHIWDDAQFPAYLFNGVTTVRDTGAAMGRLIGLRDAIEAGRRPGPRIIAGGFQFYPRSGGGVAGEITQQPANAIEASRAVALARGMGADYVKLRGPDDWPSALALIDQAHSSGMAVSSHVAFPLPLIAAGLDGQEHMAETIYDDVIQLARAARLWIVPTTVAFSSTVRLMDEPRLLDAADTAPFMTPFLRWWALRLSPGNRAPYERFTRASRSSTRKLLEAGVTVVAGADTPHVPWALHAELEELVAAGASPLQAIVAATSRAARIAGAAEDVGTIEPGKLADLIVLNASPLEDIRNTRSIWRVIKGGLVYEPEALVRAARVAQTAGGGPARLRD